MTRWYWNRVGGTLCEEYRAVARTPTCSQRLLDAEIIPDGPTQMVHWRELSVEGRDVIVVQAKAKRLGMYLMGQALFSAELVRRLGARSVKSVALCIDDDSVLGPLFRRHAGMEVVVAPAECLQPATRE